MTASKNNDLIKDNSVSTIDDLSKNSKTDDEKLKEITSMNATKSIDKLQETDTLLTSTKDVNISKSDDEKLSESQKCDLAVVNDHPNDKASQDLRNLKVKISDESGDDINSSSENEEVSDSALSGLGNRRSARIKHISEIKLEVEDAENMLDVYETEALSSFDLRDSLCRVSSPELEVC